MTATPKPLVLVTLDGLGHSESPDYNAIYAAKKSVWGCLLAIQPHDLASSPDVNVGPPDGRMGNSEVGHMNLGTGRVAYQDLARVTKAIRNGEFFKDPVIAGAVNKAVVADKAVYILGLLSPGGVHGHEDHLVAMAQMIARCDAGKIHLHTFLDGRDAPPKSTQPSPERLDATFTGLGEDRIASIIGRYFTTDHDNRQDHVQAVYELIVDGKTEFTAGSSVAALEAAYARGEGDEFIKATAVVPAGAEAMRTEDDGAVIFMNSRADRTRELSHTSVEPAFNEFPRERTSQLVDFVMPAQYATSILAPYILPPGPLTNVPGEYLAKRGRTQLHITEIEKYACVTFFFSGGREEPYEGEERILIPSPRIAIYDPQSEMSTPEVTDRIVEATEQQRYDMIAVNRANGGMVDHTGVFEAAVRTVECLDIRMRRIVEALGKVGGEALVTADHGNIEQMGDGSIGRAHTTHTCEPVPFVYVGKRKLSTHEGGALADVTPTMPTLMGLEQPAEMTGRSIAILG